MTMREIEKKARRLLQDTEMEYRWTSAEIQDALQEGIHALNAIRPETQYVGFRYLGLVSLPEGLDTPIEINDRYTEALVFYVVYKCYLMDDTDTTNQQLSDIYLNKFNTKAQL